MITPRFILETRYRLKYPCSQPYVDRDVAFGRTVVVATSKRLLVIHEAELYLQA